MYTCQSRSVSFCLACHAPIHPAFRWARQHPKPTHTHVRIHTSASCDSGSATTTGVPRSLLLEMTGLSGSSKCAAPRLGKACRVVCLESAPMDKRRHRDESRESGPSTRTVPPVSAAARGTFWRRRCRRRRRRRRCGAWCGTARRGSRPCSPPLPASGPFVCYVCVDSFRSISPDTHTIGTTKTISDIALTHLHVLVHLEALKHVHERQLLRRGHDDGPVQGEGLRGGDLDVARAWIARADSFEWVRLVYDPNTGPPTTPNTRKYLGACPAAGSRGRPTPSP